MDGNSSTPNLCKDTGKFSDADEKRGEDRSQKTPQRGTNTRQEDDTCPICYEPYENFGEHRPSCLACGHVFGKACVERWIQLEKRCPDCNTKATIKEIRVVFAPKFKAVDIAEFERMKVEIEKLRMEKTNADLRNAQLKVQLQLENHEAELIRTENEKLRAMNQNCTSVKRGAASTTSSIVSSNMLMPKLRPVKRLQIKEGQSRVGAYDERMSLLVVSHCTTSALLPSESFGIKMINALDMKALQSSPIHQKCIRDLAFSPMRRGLLLSVALDKKVVLYDCNSNCTVQTFNASSALWACCWNPLNQNLFYVGSADGQLASYDLRTLQKSVSTLSLPSVDKTGVAGLKFVPPAHQSHHFNMTGLLIQKLNSVWFTEIFLGNESDPKSYQLPMEGPFVNVDFEEGSRHVLVSSRPKTSNNQRHATSHSVCSLGKFYSTSDGRDIFGCDIVQVMHGGFQERVIMCRSAIFSPQPGKVYVAANGENYKTVRVWDTANIKQTSSIVTNQDVALGFVHGSIHATNFLGIVMENELDIYEVK